MPWHSEVFNTYSLQSVCFLSALGLLIAFAYWFVVCSVTCFKHPLPYVTVKWCTWDWPGWMCHSTHWSLVECSENCQCLFNWADLGSALWSGLEMNAPCISNPGTVVSQSLWSAAWVVLGCQECSGHSGDWKWQCIWIPKWVRPLAVASPLNNGWVQLRLHHVCVMEGNRQSSLPVCFALTYKISYVPCPQSDLKQ